MKTQKRLDCSGRFRSGLFMTGLFALLATATGFAANPARAQMILLDETPQDTAQASQTVKNSMEEYEAEKARREAARAAAAEAYRNSAEGQAAQRRMEQDQANRDAENRLKEHEKRLKKQAACDREKATGKIEGFLPACW